MMLTILWLAPSAEPMVETLIRLSRSGLVRETVLLSEDGSARVLADGQLRDVSLLEYLSAGRLDLVRLIYVTLGEPLAATTLSEIDSVVAWVSAAVPLERGVIAAPRVGTIIDRSVFRPYWNYNLIVEPIDAVGEARFIPLPLDSEPRRLALLTAAVCLVGCLWSWLQSGPLDGGIFRGQVDGAGPRHDGSERDPHVRFLRTVTRLVDAGDITAQVVRRALRPGVQLPPPPDRVVHRDPQALVAQIAQRLAPISGSSSLGFSYVPHDIPPLVEKTRMKPLAAIAGYLKEIADELRRIPAEYVQKVLASTLHSIEQRVTNHTFGADSQIVVEFNKPAALMRVVDPTSRASLVDGFPDVTVVAPPPSPQTWRLLTTACLALADGADLPAELDLASPTWEHRHAVIADLGLIASPSLSRADTSRFELNPEELACLGWACDEPYWISGTDPYAVAAVMERAIALAQSEPAGGAAQSDVRPRHDESRAAWAPPAVPASPPAATISEDALAARPMPNSCDDTLVADAATGGDGQAGDDNASAVGSPGASLSSAADPQRVVERLLRWKSEREGSLLWRLAEALIANQRLALQHVEESSSTIERLQGAIQHAMQDEQRSRKRFRRRVLLCLLLAVAGIALCCVGAFVVAGVGLILLISLGVLSSIGGLFGVFRVARTRVREKHRHVYLPTVWIEAQGRRQQAVNEYARLGSLYSQLQDWAVIIGSVLTRPIGEAEVDVIEPWRTTVGTYSFVCGVPEFDEVALMAATNTVTQMVASVGWLNAAFRSQYEYIQTDYRRRTGTVDAVEIRPEDDHSGDDGNSGGSARRPRPHFRDAFLGGVFADQYRKSIERRLADAVYARNPLDLISGVRCDVPGLNASVADPKRLRTVAEFLAPVVEYAPGVEQLADLVDADKLVGDRLGWKSVIGISSGVPATPNSDRSASIVVEPVENRFTLAAFRIDLTDPVPTSNVLLIEDAQLDGAATADGDTAGGTDGEMDQVV